MHSSPLLWMNIWQCVQETMVPTKHAPCYPRESHTMERNTRAPMDLQESLAERKRQLFPFFCSPFASVLVSFYLKDPFCNVLWDTSGRLLLFWPCSWIMSGSFMCLGVDVKLVKMIKTSVCFFLRILHVSSAVMSHHMALHSSLQLQQS